MMVVLFPPPKRHSKRGQPAIMRTLCIGNSSNSKCHPKFSSNIYRTPLCSLEKVDNLTDVLMKVEAWVSIICKT